MKRKVLLFIKMLGIAAFFIPALHQTMKHPDGERFRFMVQSMTWRLGSYGRTILIRLLPQSPMFGKMFM